MLGEGKTPEEIKQYFVDYYGARVLSEPPTTGINWLVYVVPPIAFIAGATLLFLAFRTWKKMPKEASAETDHPSPPKPGADPVKTPGAAADDDYMTRIEEELKKRN